MSWGSTSSPARRHRHDSGVFDRARTARRSDQGLLFDRDSQTELRSPSSRRRIRNAHRRQPVQDAGRSARSPRIPRTIMAEGRSATNGNQGEGTPSFPPRPATARSSSDSAAGPPLPASVSAARTADRQSIRRGNEREFEAPRARHNGGIAYNRRSHGRNQNAGSALGMALTRRPTSSSRASAFDDGSDGLNLPITARLTIVSRSSRGERGLHDRRPGDHEGAAKILPTGISLAGFRARSSPRATATSSGTGTRSPIALVTDDGGCTITFTGSSRYGNPGSFPDSRHRPREPHAAGTCSSSTRRFPSRGRTRRRARPPRRNAQIILRWNPPAAGVAFADTTSSDEARRSDAPHLGLVAGTQFTADNPLNGVEYFVVTATTAGFVDSVLARHAGRRSAARRADVHRVPGAGRPREPDASVALGLDFQANIKTVITASRLRQRRRRPESADHGGLAAEKRSRSRARVHAGRSRLPIRRLRCRSRYRKLIGRSSRRATASRR